MSSNRLDDNNAMGGGDEAEQQPPPAAEEADVENENVQVDGVGFDLLAPIDVNDQNFRRGIEEHQRLDRLTLYERDVVIYWLKNN